MSFWTVMPAWARPIAGVAGGLAPSLRSRPAQKPRPAPVSTITRHVAVGSRARRARRSSRRRASWFIAFKPFGRFSVICATPGRTGSIDDRVASIVTRLPSSSRASFSRPRRRVAVIRTARTTPRGRRSGPVHSQSSTVPTSRVGAQRREHLEPVGDVAAGRERRREPIDAAHAGDVPLLGRRRGSPRGGRSGRAPRPRSSRRSPGSPGKPSAVSPTSASQSGIDAGGTPNFVVHAVGVEQDLAAAGRAARPCRRRTARGPCRACR